MLFFQFSRPILYQSQRLAFFLHITAVDEEFRAITGDCIRPSRALGCTSAEERSRCARPNRTFRSVDVDRHQIVAAIEEKQLLTVAAPPWERIRWCWKFAI